MVCGAHQHCLVLECDAFLSMRKYLVADRRNLGILVGTCDETWAYSGLTVGGMQHGGEPLRSFSSHTICQVENLLSRSVIGAENYCPRSRKALFEMQDVTRFSSAERVDGLCIVSDDRDSFVGSAQRLQNIYLQSVHVLVFINQYVIERTREPWAQTIIKGGGPPEQEKVVEVKHASSPFAGDVAAANLDYLLHDIVCPRRHCRGYRRDGPASVDGSRIDIQQKSLAWEPLAGGLRVAALFSNEVNDVGSIGRIQYRESFGNTERMRISPQSPVCDGVKCPAHHSAGRRIRAAVPLLCGQHRTSPIQHLPRRPSREGQQENAFRWRSRRQQPRHSSREGRRLACSSARKDPKRSTFVAYGGSLGLVELLQPDEHMFDISGSGSSEVLDVPDWPLSLDETRWPS